MFELNWCVLRHFSFRSIGACIFVPPLIPVVVHISARSCTPSYTCCNAYVLVTKKGNGKKRKKNKKRNDFVAVTLKQSRNIAANEPAR